MTSSPNKLEIPNEWTFKNQNVANNFDAHVREQLPWYDLVTAMVAHIARHYIPRGGLVYDIGASTGNIGNAIKETLLQREAKLVAIEESEEMAKNYTGPGYLQICDALTYDYKPFDLAVCFLVLMFMPIKERKDFIDKLVRIMQPGGAIIVVDKVVTPAGYAGTCMRRMAMSWKLQAGASPDEVLRKEMSLAGYQRPISQDVLPSGACRWFQFGEFAGWIVEKLY